MNAAGLYIHIPFCRSRCSYCDFATGSYQSELAERYARAVSREIAEWQQVDRPGDVDTIYFGGGTPSTLLPHQLEQIITAAQTRFAVSDDAEVTMEMNPGNLSSARLTDFKRLGVNRASFGAQTFDDRELARLGRSHTAAETLETFRDLRKAGFTNISFDLIAGLPGQTMTGWLANIRTALSLRPEHLSFYLLEVHEGTPLADHIRQGRQPRPDDDLAAEMYQVMLEESCKAGYDHYEISNLSLPGYESRHNTKYWTGLPYYGFGCSAHSHDGNLRRWANERDVAGYVRLVEAGRAPVVQRWDLTESDRRSETIFLGLRMMKGINVRNHHETFGVDLLVEHDNEIQRFAEAGLIEVNGDLIRLTRAGALLSNEVFVAFL
jgi:oxygen-independent coproporphyrinogen-3 oxidase